MVSIIQLCSNFVAQNFYERIKITRSRFKKTWTQTRILGTSPYRIRNPDARKIRVSEQPDLARTPDAKSPGQVQVRHRPLKISIFRNSPDDEVIYNPLTTGHNFLESGQP